MIRKSGNRFSEKIMLHQKDRAPNRFNLKPSRFKALKLVATRSAAAAATATLALRLRTTRGPLTAQDIAEDRTAKAEATSCAPFASLSRCREKKQEGVALCIGPASAMLCIGQHYCPNWWPERAHPCLILPSRGHQAGEDARRPAAEGQGVPECGR